MAADYDAPKKTDDDAESLDALKERSAPTTAASLDGEEVSLDDDHDRENLIDEASNVMVVPPQTDEFTCSECFIVKHKSLLNKKKGKYGDVCLECA